MPKIWKAACLILIVICALTGCSREPARPEAGNGILDLSGWNFELKGPVRLDGQWMVFPRLLVGPDKIEASKRKGLNRFDHRPRLWGTQTGSEKPMPPRGAATDCLVVDGGTDSRPFALYVSNALSVGKLWINGMPVAESGRIGRKKTEEFPRNHSLTSRFTPTNSRLEIILPVSNFHNIRGGINAPIWLGPDGVVQKLVNRQWIIAVALGCTLLILGVYHLVLFSIRRSAPENLYFGLYCSFWAVQIFSGNNGGFVLASVFPDLPWHWTINLTLMPYAVMTPLAVMFYHCLFPTPSAVRVNRTFQTLGALLFIDLAITGPNAFDPTVLGYTVITMASYLYLGFRFVIDLKDRRPGILLLIPGYLLAGLTGISDVLNDLHLINAGFLLPLGTLGFVFSYSILITIRFSRAFAALQENQALKNEIRVMEERERDMARSHKGVSVLLSTLWAHKHNPLPSPPGDIQTDEKPAGLSRREQAVALMNLAVDYWITATRTTRAELASRSGLWTVYIGKDGWVRTQTMDKYLSLDTLPARPRWKPIVSTADFVLTTCNTSSHLRVELETALTCLRHQNI